MRILMIGDAVGRPGRRAIQALVPSLRAEHKLDLVIANGENLAGGFGITLETAQELLRSGVDVITSGNHVWDQKEIIPYLGEELPLLRPLNYPPGVPGRGYIKAGETLVVNLMGRVFMTALDCPFRSMDRLLGELAERTKVVVVDFHAEATSEKQAMGWYLDGRVSAVVGTHTHVPTADAAILPRGTAFVTDVGMVGPKNSIIGNDPQDVLGRFLTQTPRRLSVPGGPVSFNSVLLEVDESTGRALSITRLDREVA
ncbi:MAG: TIGR00282 family metallophosphoesterase [Chloroflexi bacterium]|nr:TIGR00282 family metallophosphoesterase [Chloroflexota bacterium]